MGAVRGGDGAIVGEHEYLRNSLSVLVGLVQNLLVELQLHQGMEIVLLGSHVHTVENPQKIALGDRVTRPQLALLRMSGLGGAILDLAELDHSGRHNAHECGRPRIEPRRAGKHERPHRFWRLSNRDRVSVALADSQGGADLLRNVQRVSTARYQQDA